MPSREAVSRTLRAIMGIGASVSTQEALTTALAGTTAAAGATVGLPAAALALPAFLLGMGYLEYRSVRSDQAASEGANKQLCAKIDHLEAQLAASIGDQSAMESLLHEIKQDTARFDQDDAARATLLLQAAARDDAHDRIVSTLQEHWSEWETHHDARLNDVVARLDSLAEGQQEIKEQVAQTKSQVIESERRVRAQLNNTTERLVRTLETEQARSAGLAQHRDQLRAENKLLRFQVRAVVEARARDELGEGHSVEAVLASLRRTKPRHLLTYLDHRIELSESRAGDPRREPTSQDSVRHELLELHRQRAAIALALGETRKAEQSLERIFTVAPDDIKANDILGDLQKVQGELRAACKTYRRVLDMAPDDEWRAVTLGKLGVAELLRGNFHAASKCLFRSLKKYEQLGRDDGVADQLHAIGLLFLPRRGFRWLAKRNLQRALQINDRLGREAGIAADYSSLGLVEWKCGNLNVAETYHKRALEVHKRNGQRERIAADLANLGLIERTRGNTDAARRHFKRALDLFEQIGARDRANHTRRLLASLDD